ncbi:MAG: hypothetical protein M3R35_08055 [Candidatus Eremiobacteraeota bacterium]|nr:hypothetical protein [Candidatus Eremiobacteraeota bacterium]
MKPQIFVIFPLAALALTATLASADPAKPVRHVVYHFDVSMTSTLTTHSSGVDDGTGGSGLADYSGGSADKGTIALDVLQVGSDGGLAVQVTETAQNNRSAKATTCLVYNDGRLNCDPNGKVNEEEMALLQVASRDFVDPTQFDAHKHWRVGGSSNGFTTSTDYTLTGGDPAGVVTIALQRVDKVEGAQGYNATTDGTVTYDVPLSIPTAVKEDAVMRQNRGMGQDNRVDTHITLNLISDSLANAKKS